MIAEHINNTFVLRIDHETVVVSAIATIHGMTLGIRHRGQCHLPVGALVFAHENARMVAISIDARHINNIGIRRSDGERSLSFR